MNKFKDKYRIPSNRLAGYDYGSEGAYFITICTQNKVHYFGEIVSPPSSNIAGNSDVETDNYPSTIINVVDKINVETDNYPSTSKNIVGKSNVETDNYPSAFKNIVGKSNVETDNYPSTFKNILDKSDVETDNYPSAFKNILDKSDVETDNYPSAFKNILNNFNVETDNYPSAFKNILNNFNVETDNYPSLRITNNTIKETDNYPSLRATVMGEIALKFWLEIPKHYPFVELDQFIIMPNHIHGILILHSNSTDWVPNKFGRQSKNLGSVIRGFKASTKRFANQNSIQFEWQDRYYDHIIRNDASLNYIRQYIFENPIRWIKSHIK